MSLVPDAKVLEVEMQAIWQKKHDIQFGNDVAPGSVEKELARQEGKIEGIEWTLKRFKRD